MWSHDSICTRVQGAAVAISAKGEQRRRYSNHFSWPAGCAIIGIGSSSQCEPDASELHGVSGGFRMLPSKRRKTPRIVASNGNPARRENVAEIVLEDRR